MNYKQKRHIAKKKALRAERLKKFSQSTPAGFLETPSEAASGARQKRLDMDKDSKKLYGLSTNDQKIEDTIIPDLAPNMGTRLSPETLTQMYRVEDGVYQDTITGKKYDRRKGYSANGIDYPPSSVSYQTDLIRASRIFKDKGLIKESRILKVLAKIKK